MRSFDQAVVGLSLAGIAAALELAASGRSVCLMDHPGDPATLPGHAFIDPTPLHPTELSGDEFQRLALQRLEEAGVVFEAGFIVDRIGAEGGDGGLLLVHEGQAARRVRSVLFAPNGRSAGLPEEVGAERILGRGVSYDAASDGGFFAGERAAVVGTGAWALHQALVASQSAALIMVLCEAGVLRAPASLVRRAEAEPSIDFFLGVRLRSILSDEWGQVSGVVLTEGARERTLPLTVLYVAQELQAALKLANGQHVERSLVAEGRVIPCGLAAGFAYWDRPALYFRWCPCCEAESLTGDNR